jgi:hypothetical protein
LYYLLIFMLLKNEEVQDRTCLYLRDHMRLLVVDGPSSPQDFNVKKTGFFALMSTWLASGKSGPECWFLQHPAASGAANVMPDPVHPLSYNFRTGWFHEAIVRRAIRRNRIDILILPGGLSLSRIRVPQIVWLPFLPAGDRQSSVYCRKLVRRLPQTLQTAVAVWTPSTETRDNLAGRFPWAAPKIRVVPLFPEQGYRPFEWHEKQGYLKQFSGGKEYFLVMVSLTAEEPVLMTLRAFTQFKRRQRSNMQLVITVIHKGETAKWKSRLPTYKHRDDVHVLENPPKDVLTSITACAYAVIFIEPSMQLAINAGISGVPLINAGRGENIQTAMEAPDQDAMAQAMMILYKDETQRKEWIVRSGSMARSSSLQQSLASLEEAFLEASQSVKARD